MQIREITIEDFDKLIIFWRQNYFVADADNLKSFALFLEKNSGLSLLVEENGEIIGSALGSFDGRRGYIQKIVVAKAYRKKGLGKEIVEKVIEKLKKAGAKYIPISVEDENVQFYEECGFTKTSTTSMTLDLTK